MNGFSFKLVALLLPVELIGVLPKLPLLAIVVLLLIGVVWTFPVIVVVDLLKLLLATKTLPMLVRSIVTSPTSLNTCNIPNQCCLVGSWASF